MGYKDPAQRAAKNKAWREKNIENLRTKRREYYLANRERIAQKNKAYKAALLPEVRAARRKRYQENHCLRAKKRYHATRAWFPWLNSLRGSKQRAKRLGIPFELTKAWATERWTGRCEVTNIPFVLSTARNPYLFSPSLDRIDPIKGYTCSNCRFVLHAVNALKGQGTNEQMLLIAKAIVDQNAAPPMLLIQAPETDLAEIGS